MNADIAHWDTLAWKDTPDNLLSSPAHSVKNKKHKTWSSWNSIPSPETRLTRRVSAHHNKLPAHRRMR
jgi:hypothetical protein